MYREATYLRIGFGDLGIEAASGEAGEKRAVVWAAGIASAHACFVGEPPALTRGYLSTSGWDGLIPI